RADAFGTGDVIEAVQVFRQHAFENVREFGGEDWRRVSDGVELNRTAGFDEGEGCFEPSGVSAGGPAEGVGSDDEVLLGGAQNRFFKVANRSRCGGIAE